MGLVIKLAKNKIMFTKARLKLTAWYLLIIMAISIAFSLAIYNGLSNEVERFAHAQRVRILSDFSQYQPSISPIDNDLVEETKHRIILSLVVINEFILIAAGSLGYFLAGKTLYPIQMMMDEQNRFISDASHELKTPLTSLKTAMEVSLRDKNLTLTDAKTLISESILDVNKLQTLSEELLKLSQNQKINKDTKFENLSISLLTKEAINKMKLIAQKKQIIINNKVNDLTILANRYSFVDLLVIILDNAIKYSPLKSQIYISSKNSRKTITILIKDEGIGISKEDLPNVFNRFYRTDVARSRSTEGGYGLGLSIAKKIVDNHKGTIKVSSTIKKGTTVSLSFPLFSKV